MVNKNVVCKVAVLFLLLTIATTTPVPYSNNDHYDQRQKGGENYRLNWDGIVIAAGPTELFSEAISAADIDIDALLEELNEINKPKPPPASSLVEIIAPPSKPKEPRPAETSVVPDVKTQESRPAKTNLITGVKTQEYGPAETNLITGVKTQESSPAETLLIPDVKLQESKPQNTPQSDITLTPETKWQKKDSGAFQKRVKGQRLKSLLARLVVPVLRRNRD